MNAEYVRNLNHNYIKVKSEDDFFEYQLQMIMRNEIEGLLSCKVERSNNEVYFLYEINSKLPFVQVFERKKMNMEAFSALVLCLKNAVENASEYLLDVNSIVLTPEYIYMNPETKEVSLLYVPGMWSDIKEEFRELTRQLLEWIDYDDDAVVKAAYQLNNSTVEENYSFEEILNNILFKDDEKSDSETDNKYDDEINYENTEKQYEYSNKHSKSENYINQQDSGPDNYNLYEDDIDAEDERRQSILKKITTPVIQAAGSFLKNLELFHKDNEEYIDNEDGEEEFYEQPAKKIISYSSYTQNYRNYDIAAEEGTYGNTVLFKENKDRGKIIVPINADKYNSFELNIFPFIIGKLVEAVDGVIEDDSVSRIHAKIEKSDGQFYFVDLNSTNGSFVNGQSAPPNSRVKLNVGDRIQFGHVEYKFENI